MRHPRWLNRWFARIAGYFWLPCPRCGLMFGGHEIGGVDYVTNYLGSTTCWRCPTDRTLLPSGHWRDGHWLFINGDLCEIRRRP